MRGQVMEFHTADGKLYVNYSERLVTLIREVRTLGALGYPIATKIDRTAEQAAQYYQHATILQQVASFYNSISTQMIPCQQPLMLETALEFERLVKNPKTGT